MKNLIDPQLTPQSLEDEVRPYLFRLGTKIALSGQHKKHPFGEAREGTGEGFYFTLGP